MNTKYDTEAWANQTGLGRRIFNYNFHLVAKEFKDYALVKTIILSETAGLTETAWLFENRLNQNNGIVRVDIAERYGWRQAQATLLRSLNDSMRPDIPNGTKKLSAVGDVNYVSRSTESGLPSAISFVRGNISVQINNVAERKSDLSDIAVQLDHTLSTPPTTDQLRKIALVRRLVLQPSNFQPHGNYDLVRSLSEITAETTWVQIFVSSGELVRDGDTIIHVPDPKGDQHTDIFAWDRD